MVYLLVSIYFTYSVEEEVEKNFNPKLLMDQELSSFFEKAIAHDHQTLGAYDREERISKILKYKNKIRKWRKEHPVKKDFHGRSVVAVKKPRIKGKFVTLEEYAEHIKN